MARNKRELVGYMHHNALQVMRKHKDPSVSTCFFWQNFMKMRSSPYIVWGQAASEPDAFPPFLVLQGSAYGPRLTQKLFAATQALLVAISSDMHMDQTRYKISDKEKRIIHSTARWKMDEDRDRPEESSTRRTLSEGIVSSGQSLALLSAQRVRGYNDPNKLIDALV